MVGGCPLVPKPEPGTATQTVGDECAAQPAGTLTKKNVKPVTLNTQPIIESGQIRAGQNIGYEFAGKANQRFSYKTDNVCVWLYTPDNQLLQSGELPVDGTYIVQIGLPKGRASFNLEMGLSDS